MQRRSAEPWLAAAFFAALVGLLHHELIACVGSCFVDLGAMHGPQLGRFELTDTKLNAWILAWVQKSLTSSPFELYRTNAFYPFPNALAGSEHLLGVALPTLPLRVFTDNAIAIYQSAWMLSYFVLGLSTWSLTRWLGAPGWIAILVGSCALAMPWRIAELTHLQLLSAHWFPFVWLLLLRLLGTGRGALPLAIVLTLQLLSSYYLAYQITASIALILICEAAFRWREKRALPRAIFLRASSSLLFAYATLALVSIPYLARKQGGDLQAMYDANAPMPVANFFRVYETLRPRLETFFGLDPESALLYSIPLGVAMLAALALPLALVPPRGEVPRAQRLCTLALTCFCLLCIVMMLGSQLEIGETVIRLPGYFAAQLVPGFSNLRAPHRWGVGIGIASPVLAGIALTLIAARLRDRAPLRRGILVLATLVVLLTVPWRILPAAPAYAKPGEVEAVAARLRALPTGPLLELPWHAEPLLYLSADTEYMLASTEHWQPLLNGFTAYLPPSFRLLRRISQRLPAEEALALLSRLTDLRYLVLHRDRMNQKTRTAWQAALRRGSVRELFSHGDTLVLEVPRDPRAGAWLPALAAGDSGEKSIGGAARTPLNLEPGAGTLKARVEGPLRLTGQVAPSNRLYLEIENTSNVSWPGLGLDGEGRIELRYEFLDSEGSPAREDSAPIDIDVAPGARVSTIALLRSPREGGRYGLCVDLVQRLGDELRPLPVPPLSLEVTVLGGAKTQHRLARQLVDIYESQHPDSELAGQKCWERLTGSALFRQE